MPTNKRERRISLQQNVFRSRKSIFYLGSVFQYLQQDILDFFIKAACYSFGDVCIRTLPEQRNSNRQSAFAQSLIAAGIDQNEAWRVAPLLDKIPRSPEEQLIVNSVWRQWCVLQGYLPLALEAEPYTPYRYSCRAENCLSCIQECEKLQEMADFYGTGVEELGENSTSDAAYVLLVGSIDAAIEIAWMLRGDWDGCNGILLPHPIDEVAVEQASQLQKTEFCEAGDYCHFNSQDLDVTLEVKLGEIQEPKFEEIPDDLSEQIIFGIESRLKNICFNETK